uniref:Uncharacterized protein n=1 Tax=Oryza rufipogon TaxID=4529 RepID=A0A0E0QP12_ORYRU
MMTTQPPWRRTGPTPERGARGRSAPPLGPRHRRVVGGGGEDAGAAPLDRRRSNPPTGAVAVATPPPLRLAPAPSSCRSALCGWKRKRGRERERRGEGKVKREKWYWWDPLSFLYCGLAEFALWNI